MRKNQEQLEILADESDEDIEDIAALPPQTLLLRWLNIRLKDAGYKKTIKNINTDLRVCKYIYNIIFMYICLSLSNVKAYVFSLLLSLFFSFLFLFFVFRFSFFIFHLSLISSPPPFFFPFRFTTYFDFWKKKTHTHSPTHTSHLFTQSYLGF